MKFTSAISTLLILAPAFASIAQAAVIVPRADAARLQARQNANQRGGGGRQGGGRGGGRGGNAGGNTGGNAGNNGGNQATTTAATTTAAPAATSAAAGNGGNNNNNNNNNNGGNGGNAGGNAGGDIQSSTTLDSSQIQSALLSTGQGDITEAGQVESLTSPNNFINFCATTNLPLTNGAQVVGGSCNPTIIGSIVAQANMPATKFQFPKNGQTIPANQQFTISMAIKNMATGFFTNPANTYYQAPIQLDGSGLVKGHSHVTVQPVSSADDTNIPDVTKFAFFKGFNQAAQGGVLTADVTKGLAAGNYRMCSITTAANHQMVLGAVAQRGAIDDCSYFQVK